MEGEEKPLLGRRVVVYGGGNTAMDAARTAKRLGATDAVVVYRRNRERMPAHEFEVAEAEEEGVMMRWLETIKQVDGGKVTVEKMELDETGFPQPTGELEELEADSVILALGQEADLSLLEGVSGIEVDDGVVEVGPNMMTGHEGVFAGGDMVPAERTVTVGVGHGKKAARNIDGWLRDLSVEPPPKHEVVTFDQLNTWYYADAPRSVQPELEIERRRSTFDEVVGGLDESNALYEARRCMSCGNCFSCDNCYGVCPDNAVIKLDRPERAALRDRPRLLQGLRPLRRGVPLRRDRDDPGDDLMTDRAPSRTVELFGRFRVAFWACSAGIVGLYIYGLVWGAYSPLALGGGLLSIACLALLVLFAFHEIHIRREMRKHRHEMDHSDRERRGF